MPNGKEAQSQQEPVAPAQAILYRFLARAFAYPEAGTLSALQGMLPLVREAVAELQDQAAAAGRSLEGQPPAEADLVAALDRAAETALAELQAEYTRLFIAGYPLTPLRLLESVQREGTLVGEAADDAALWYLRFGLEARKQEPDHLVAELEFMDYLSSHLPEDADAATRHRDARRAFLREHLLAWVPELVVRIPDHTEMALYRIMAQLLGWLLAVEMVLDPALRKI